MNSAIAHLIEIKNKPENWGDPITVKVVAEMLIEKIKFIESLVLRNNNPFIHSITIRLYCSCGDAIISDGTLEGVSLVLENFAARHHGEGHSPCTPRQAAAARRRKSRGLPPPQPIIPEGQAELFHLRPRKV